MKGKQSRIREEFGFFFIRFWYKAYNNRAFSFPPPNVLAWPPKKREHTAKSTKNLRPLPYQCLCSGLWNKKALFSGDHSAVATAASSAKALIEG